MGSRIPRFLGEIILEGSNGREKGMGKLSGKTAIVTGAAKGIGAGIARALGSEGAAVVVNYASDRAGAERVVRDVAERGGKALAVQGDVSKAADVRRLFEETTKAFGSVDVLVNNAGVYVFESIESASEEQFHRQFNTNVLGPVLAIREALKYIGPKGASIINVSSIASRVPVPTTSVYSATKGALNSLTLVLAAELGPRKIRVNTLSPGVVETEGTVTMGLIGSDGEKQLTARTPLGRTGRPDDIAKVAVFLASDESAWITGENLAASGGLR